MGSLISYILGVVFSFATCLAFANYKERILTKYEYLALGLLSLFSWTTFFVAVVYIIYQVIKMKREEVICEVDLDDVDTEDCIGPCTDDCTKVISDDEQSEEVEP